jgi:hypothetical protein
MNKWIIMLLVTLNLMFASALFADECMEGDCDNGVGSGFTDDNKIYEGEWKDGLPHGQGILYVSRGKVVEGIWEKGELVKEKAGEKEENLKKE